MRRDTIRRLAEEIRQLWPHLEVRVERWRADTDRKVGRLRWPGKGRDGSRLLVYDRKKDPLRPIYDHKNSETYRCCADVRGWMERYALLRKPRPRDTSRKDGGGR